MYQIKNLLENDDIRVLTELGPFTVIEYLRDLSVSPANAATAYFASEMNVRRRQVICDLKKPISHYRQVLCSGWLATSMPPQASKA